MTLSKICASFLLLFSTASALADDVLPEFPADEGEIPPAALMEVNHNASTRYDYDVKKNPFTGTKTYQEESKSETKIGNRTVIQRFRHRTKVARDGRVLEEDQTISRKAE